MLSSNENGQRFPDCVRVHIHDTDQTDVAEPVGHGVWNGVLLTIVLLIIGIGMMRLFVLQDNRMETRPSYERSVPLN